jgi:Bacteriophage lambda head decoration protein D
MATLATETQTAGAALLSEANGTLSRDAVVVVSGAVLKDNQVVGKITASSKYKAYDNAAADGSEVAAGVLLRAVDATGADKPGVIIERFAEFKADALDWGTNDGTGKTAGTADLLARNIKIRA